MPTKLPEVVSYSTIFQAKFEGKISYFRRVFDAASELPGYANWHTDTVNVVMRDFSKRRSVVFQYAGVMYRQDSGDLESERAGIAELLKATEPLQIKNFTALVLKRRYLVKLDVSYAEIVTLVRTKLLNLDLSGIGMAGRIKDFHVKADVQDAPFTYHWQVGPVKKDQLELWMPFDKDSHLDPKRKEIDYAAILKEYPEQALFIEVDSAWETQPTPVAEALKFVELTTKQNTVIARQLSDYVLSSDLETSS